MFNINRKHAPLGTGDSRERPPEGCEVPHHVGQPASASCSALSGPPGNHLTLELKASQSLRTNRKFKHCSKGRFLQNDWFLTEVTKTQATKFPPSKVLLKSGRLFPKRAQLLMMLIDQLLQVVELALSVLSQQTCPPKDGKNIKNVFSTFLNWTVASWSIFRSRALGTWNHCQSFRL